MKRIFSLLAFTIFSLTIIAQDRMRPLAELINKADPGWKFVKQWISAAKNKVEVLPADPAKANAALFETQVTTRSPMGAVVYMTGGLLIDNGWIRIGSGNEKLTRTLPGWNKGKSLKDSAETTGFLLIADDAIGGFFILNGGYFNKEIGKVYYFSPDNLEFEPLNLTYTDFLLFCFNNNLDEFYKGYRWKNWKDDLSKLNADQVFSFYPPLWSKEGKDFEKNSKKIVPVGEQFGVNLYFRKQLGIDK